jgi:hypothetical protein
MRGTQKARKTGHHTIEERLGDSVFLETKGLRRRGKTASRNGFVSGVYRIAAK